MSLTSQEKEKIFKKFGGDNKDTGSVYSQVALFTKKLQIQQNILKKIEKISQPKDHYN